MNEVPDDLRQLFNPFDGNCIKPNKEQWVVYVPYADHEPVSLPSLPLAEQVEAAIQAAFSHGVSMGGSDD